MSRGIISSWALPILMLATLTGCEGRKSVEMPPDSDTSGSGLMAVAELRPTGGHEAYGKVMFRMVDGGVQVNADLNGLEAGSHGFHIHEFGDCGSDGAASAGGHYAPLGSRHGAPGDPPGHRHVGDLGNIQADAQGRAEYERIDPLLGLRGDNSIIGKAVIVHQGADDLISQPSGAAGARVACGVISLSDEG